MESVHNSIEEKFPCLALARSCPGTSGVPGDQGEGKGETAAWSPDACLITSFLPFPVVRQHLGADLSLFVIQANSRPHTHSFHCPTENAPLEFIYCLRGTATIKLARAGKNMPPFRLGGGFCLTTHLPDAQGELSFHAGPALQAVVLQAQPAFLSRLHTSGDQHMHSLLRNIIRHAQQPYIETTGLPFALHILLQQICGYGASGVLSDIFLCSKKYELFYKQMELNAPVSLLPDSISRAEYLAAYRVYEQLRENIAYQPNLADLAASAGLNRGRLTTLFRSLFGNTVFGVLRRERLACACQMLDEAPEKNLTEIAYLCGFSSSAHFTKAFIAQYGVTPREYRQCYRLP